jgi:hypothetical protein
LTASASTQSLPAEVEAEAKGLKVEAEVVEEKGVVPVGMAAMVLGLQALKRWRLIKSEVILKSPWSAFNFYFKHLSY